MRELAASQATKGKCPGCETAVPLEPREREVKTVDGEARLVELVGECPRCRKFFFPAT